MKRIFYLKKKAKPTINKYFELFTYVCMKYTHANLLLPLENPKTQYAQPSILPHQQLKINELFGFRICGRRIPCGCIENAC
jgi:hypothetical protein